MAQRYEHQANELFSLGDRSQSLLQSRYEMINQLLMEEEAERPLGFGRGLMENVLQANN